MGGSSKIPSKTEQVVKQETLAPWAAPYAKRLLKRGEVESLQGYTPYSGQRIMPFMPAEVQAQEGIMGMARAGSPMQQRMASQTTSRLASGRGNFWQPQQPRMYPMFGGGGGYGGMGGMGGYGGMGGRGGGYGGGYGGRPGQISPSDPRFRSIQGGLQVPIQGFGQQQPPGGPPRPPQIPHDAEEAKLIEQGFGGQTFRRPSNDFLMGRDKPPGGGGWGGGAPPRQPGVQPLPGPPSWDTGRPPWAGGGGGWGMPPRQPFMDNRAIDPSQSFNMGVAQRYMSPYQQSVTDIEKREARRESEQQGTGIGLQAAGSGGLGGYREAIMQSERQRNLGQQLGDIQAKGLQGGYDRAAQQLQADRSATLAAQQQQLGAAGTLGQLGAQEQALGMERLQGMEAAGQRQRAFQQAMLDTGYQDFQRQLGYPQQQMGFQQQLIHGLPIPTSVSESTYARQPGMFQTGLGLGLQGLGLYNAMQGGGGG